MSNMTPLIYTVPKNATLIDAVMMTALIGRIPVKGQVADPYPFKLIVGKENLAANGIKIPNIDGMVFSGIAKGDMNLSCVSGDITSVTYVFDDGTITTESSEGESKNHLGWISDPQGVPCISGKFITNAPAYLSAQVGIGSLAAGAGAFAASQTSSSLNLLGGATTNITGNKGQYLLGQMTQSGMQSVSQWLTDRQGQSFDAVFVPAGNKVAIHIDKALNIDYDPQGRKISYEQKQNPTVNDHLD